MNTQIQAHPRQSAGRRSRWRTAAFLILYAALFLAMAAARVEAQAACAADPGARRPDLAREEQP